MNDLDCVLKKFAGSEITVFNDDGKFTTKGYIPYLL